LHTTAVIQSISRGASEMENSRSVRAYFRRALPLRAIVVITFPCGGACRSNRLSWLAQPVRIAKKGERHICKIRSQHAGFTGEGILSAQHCLIAQDSRDAIGARVTGLSALLFRRKTSAETCSRSSRIARATDPRSSPASFLPKWHDHLGDPTIADAICDQILHNAHRLVLTSRRKEESTAEK